MSKPLALVTGASSGIGAAYTERLAGDGYEVIAVARRRDRLEEVRARAGAGGVRIVTADLSTPEGVAAIALIAGQEPLELLVNNAGVGHYMSFSELPDDRFEELIGLNIDAPLRLVHAAVPGMVQRARGAIVNVASLLAFSAAATNPRLPKRAMYVGSKAMLVGLSRILAEELKEAGIRVQALCPPAVRTEFHTRQGLDLSAIEKMEPDEVVSASMKALERGEVVCMPSVQDESLLGQADASALELLSNARGGLAPRYR
jgi:short-subunit dehydrogenase